MSLPNIQPCILLEFQLAGISISCAYSESEYAANYFWTLWRTDKLVIVVGKRNCEHDISSVLERVYGCTDHGENEGRRD